MGNGTPAPGNAHDQGDRPAADEFDKMEEVMRASQKHREGGVDPEPEAAEADPDPDS